MTVLDLPRNTVVVRTPRLHADQVRIAAIDARFKVGRCGRRWGKTKYGARRAARAAGKGQYIGWFAPEYKFIADAQREIEYILEPLKQTHSKDGSLITTTGGRVDFWSLENELAGRSRGYHGIVIDEAAFTKDNMLDIWRRNLRPTLLDYRGWCLVLSNTNGVSDTNFLWQICNQPQHGFTEFHAPSHNNPLLDRDELEELRHTTHPMVYQQEYLAEFVDWSGVAFFSRDNLLVNGKPAVPPKKCDLVFAVVDTATKSGSDNDGTGVIYFAYTRVANAVSPHRLVMLDYELFQMEGALLETWLPNVYKRLETMAGQCGSRGGSGGAFIEDKASGMVLLQQARRRGHPAQPIDSKLTSVGKDERAISVSGYVYQGLVKIGQEAWDRVINYKGTIRNHLLAQVNGFKIGDKDAAKRADDLLDCFCYGVALALGDKGGF